MLRKEGLSKKNITIPALKKQITVTSLLLRKKRGEDPRLMPDFAESVT